MRVLFEPVARRLPIIGAALLVAVAFAFASPPAAIAEGSAASIEEGRAWPTWGNLYIADCTFAAASDWELVALRYEPREADVIRQFHEAGGSDTGGLNWERFEGWWLHHGIGGVRVRLREVNGEDILLYASNVLPQALAKKLRSLLERGYRPIAELSSHHAVVFVGYSTAGPAYVTWGETRTMTWAEWRREAWGLYLPYVVD